MKQVRNSNVEYLRVVLMLGIYLWHVLVHGMSMKALWRPNVTAQPDDVCWLVLTVPAVDCFMLISGYYGIRFSYRKILRFVLQGFLFCYALLAVHWAIWHTWDIQTVWQLLPISSGRWWFLTAYVSVMLFAPLLNSGIEQLERRQFQFCLGFLLLINFCGFIQFHTVGTSLTTFLLLYLLGRYLHKYEVRPGRKAAALLWLVASILLFAWISEALDSHDRHTFKYLDNNNPLVMLQAFGLFFFTLSLRPRVSRIGQFLGAHCFAIYLVTEFFRKELFRWLAHYYQTSLPLCLAIIVGTSLLFIAVDWLQSLLNGWLSDRIIKLKNKYVICKS